MKRISIIVLTALIALGLAGCGGSAPKTAPAASSTASQVKYVELEEKLDAEEYGIGFRKDDIAFGLEVQKTLDEMIADGTAAIISEKWFGTDVLLKNMPYRKESSAPAADRSLETIKAKGKIILGLDDSYPPMGFRDDKNQIVGFDIDLATEVASRMGLSLELQPIDWAAKELELNAGKIDCIWNGMTITDERLENMFFAKAYIANEQIIYSASNSGITKISDLEGKKVGLQAGSSSVDALEKNPIKDKIGEIVEYPDMITGYTDLKAGRIDAFIIDSVVGRYMISKE
jgi:ABC-type amino acid transport substrate-binding protein